MKSKKKLWNWNFKKDKIRGAKTLQEEYEKKIDLYAQKIKKYDGEKAEISKEAKRLEGLRDDAQKHSGVFGLAVIFFADSYPTFINCRFK